MSPVRKTPVPDLMTCLIGYRAWRFTNRGLLVSMNDEVHIPPMEPMKATCTRGSSVFFRAYSDDTHFHKGEYSRPPAPFCSCGIYCFKSMGDVEALVRGGQVVYGPIRIWGRIIEHDRGYRAEYAYPAGPLYINRAPDGVVERIEELYRVRVIINSLEVPQWIDEESAHFYPSLAQLHALGVSSGKSPIIPYPTPKSPLSPPKTRVVVGVNRAPILHRANRRVVKPTRYQLKQYAGVDIPHVLQVDWRDILRGIIFKKPPVLIRFKGHAINYDTP